MSHALFFRGDDATVVGTVPAAPAAMEDQSIEQRVAVLERHMGGRTLEEHFREHAELIDRRFAEVHARFTAQDRRFDAIEARFVAIDKRFDAIESRFTAIDSRFTAIDSQFVAVHSRFEAMDERFNRVDHEIGLIRRDLSGVRDTVNLILTKVDALVANRSSQG